MNVTIKGSLGVAALTLPFLLLPASCEDVRDCFEVCNRYSDCVEDIDVTECTDLCEDRVDNNQQDENDLIFCEDCIDDRSCLEVIEAGCFDSCPVVPVPE